LIHGKHLVRIGSRRCSRQGVVPAGAAVLLYRVWIAQAIRITPSLTLADRERGNEVLQADEIDEVGTASGPVGIDADEGVVAVGSVPEPFEDRIAARVEAEAPQQVAKFELVVAEGQGNR
jgi:hypothetical protein